jgi:hypothetical protein
MCSPLDTMSSHRDLRAFLAFGAWVPLEVETQLLHHLKVLQAWATAHEPLEPSITRLIHIQLADIEHLLDLGRHCNLLVSADRWRAAVRDLERLIAWLAAPR